MVAVAASFPISTAGASDRVDDIPGVVVINGSKPPPDSSGVQDSDFQLRHDAADLVDFHKDLFAGEYVSEDGVVVIVAATEEGVAAASKMLGDRQDARIDMMSVSLTDVMDAVSAWVAASPELASHFHSAWLNVRTRELEVVVNNDPTIRDLASLGEIVRPWGIAARLFIDPNESGFTLADSRQEEASPYAGGARYARVDSSASSGTTTGFCSTGFGYKIGAADYMLTAGHCFPQQTDFHYMWTAKLFSTAYVKNVVAGNRQGGDTSWNDASGTVQGGLDNGWHGDLAIVNVSVFGRTSGDHIWWGAVGTTVKIPVTSRIAPHFEDPICFNGYVSGSDCGTVIVETNGMYTLGGEQMKWGDIAESSSVADCPTHGDSGGSIIYNHQGAETDATAIGVVSGFSTTGGDCTMLFTGAEEAMQRWGGSVKVP